MKLLLQKLKIRKEILVIIFVLLFGSINAQNYAINKDYNITEIELPDSLLIFDFNILFPNNPALSLGKIIYEPIIQKIPFASKSHIFYSFSPCYPNSSVLFLKGDTLQKSVFVFNYSDSTLQKIADVNNKTYKIFSLDSNSFFALTMIGNDSCGINLYQNNSHKTLYQTNLPIETIDVFGVDKFLFVQLNKILLYENQKIINIYINSLPIISFALSDNGEIYYSDVSGIYLIKSKNQITEITSDFFGELFFINDKLFVYSKDKNKIFILESKNLK